MIKHNRFRPLLAGIISAALVMTGCGGEKQARADIEKVVGSFFSSAFSLDLEGALACIDESSDYYTECSENGPLGLSADGMDPKAVLGEETGELLGDSADDFFQGIIDLTKRHSSYTVNEIELTDKNKASVTVTMSLPDFKEMDLSESMTVEDIGFDTSDFLAYVAELSRP